MDTNKVIFRRKYRLEMYAAYIEAKSMPNEKKKKQKRLKQIECSL